MSEVTSVRLSRLFAVFDRPWLRRALRCAGWTVVGLYFAFAVLVLALRLFILPQIESFRPQLERALGHALDRPVSIREVEAYWVGLRPALSLKGIDIRDRQGRSALGLEQVETELAWDSLAFLQLRLNRLEILGPDLVVRRDAAGHFFVAGLEFDPAAEGDGRLGDWLLAQHRIIVREAAIRWIDESRGAPPLELKRLNIELDNRFSRHRFGATAVPPPALAAGLDVRGDFHGRGVDTLPEWRGQIYANLDTTDLAAWRQWIDYPVALPQGQGGVRLWLDIARSEVVSATADIHLNDIRMQLRPDLPELDLEHLAGRVAANRVDRGYAVEARGLRLSARDGPAFPPTHFRLTVKDAGAGQPAQGEFAAGDLDLAALARFAAHLPLDAALRKRLEQHRPVGRVHDLALAWHGAPGEFKSWQVKGRFEDIGLAALGPVPGLAGIGGRIEGDHTGGRLEIQAKNAAVDLPAIFPEPHIALESFVGEIGWRPTDAGIEVNLQKIGFENRDAAGEATGRWHPSTAHPDGPGVIDLHARLTRADGNAVWRYLPSVVGERARVWLREALVGGSGREATLRLNGDLYDFPFVHNKGGQFLVKGSFRNARLDYAAGWPSIEGVDGELTFEGARMLITASKAQVMGVSVREARAEIADLLANEELLTVSGKAVGATADFLRFIEASPVGERIDHFTAPMQAEGKGELEIKLRLPLRNLDAATVAGDYRLDGNQLTVDPDLPPLTDVRGRVLFTADSLDSKGLRAALLGAPLAIDIRTAGDAAVTVTTGGEISAGALRRHFASPVFDHLSGSTRWDGRIRIRKGAVDVAINSGLNGISSSLPPPFNKTATETLPLRFERRAAPPAPAVAAKAGTAGKADVPPAKASPGGKVDVPPAKVSLGGTAPEPQDNARRDLVEVAVGREFRAQLVRRRDAGGVSVRRGAVAFGPAAVADFPGTLPDNAIRIDGKLALADADFWRRAFANGNGAPAPSLPPLQFDLQADELRLFGRAFRDIHVSGNKQGNLSRFDLKSPGLAGNFAWDAAGTGRVTGRIGQLAIPESVNNPEHLQSQVGEIVDDLPALDLTVDKLSFKQRELGRLTMNAENRDGYWNARIDLRNDDAELKGTMRWRPAAKGSAPAETRLDFDLDAKNAEKLLGRIGYADSLRRGTAKLDGKLAWRGAPFPIDYPTLTGDLRAEAAGGQFAKLEPGVGRLLGVLSLQSLPRRITLDFRDIFSEGFAFDKIEGKFDVARGIMRTEGLQIQGPSAKVLMNGAIDLGAETQDLKVRVQPAVGETIAVGAMLANPVAGAVAWVAQKLLKDPLDQAFAFEYAVTGGWKEPKVEKLGQVKPPPAEEKK